MPEAQIDIRLLEPGDLCTGLSAGHADYAPLKTFFKKYARAFHEQSLAITYVAIDVTAGKLVGYITLICSQISTDLALVGGGFPYGDYPAVKIARLLMDSGYRSKGIGKALVDLAVGIAKAEISPKIGCRFVVVDSKKRAVEFYQKRGFTLLDTPDNAASPSPLLFIDLLKV